MGPMGQIPAMRTRTKPFAVATFAFALALTPQAVFAQSKDDARIATQIDTLTLRVEKLEATRAVKKLQRAFGYYVDRGLWQDAADLFTDDGTAEIGLDGVYAGKQRVHDYLEKLGGGQPGLIYGQLNEFVTLQPVIDVSADGRTAKARWRDLGMLGQYKKHAEWRDGIYENTYEKGADGVWRIKSLHLYVNLVALAVAVPAHAQSVEQRIAAYQHRVELLEDQDAIENLQATYGYYFDKGLWDQAADLFSADGTFEYGQRGVYVGVPHIRRAMLLFGPQGLAAGHLNTHMLLQPVITVAEDGKTAAARWQGMIQLAEPGQHGVWGVGVYENENVKQGGVWKNSKLHFYVPAAT